MCQTMFIKFIDESVAAALSACGFSYMEEKINNGQTLYVFERSDELMAALNEVLKGDKYQNVICVPDSMLLF